MTGRGGTNWLTRLDALSSRGVRVGRMGLFASRAGPMLIRLFVIALLGPLFGSEPEDTEDAPGLDSPSKSFQRGVVTVGRAAEMLPEADDSSDKGEDGEVGREPS
jgi:hypothetical protein